MTHTMKRFMAYTDHPEGGLQNVAEIMLLKGFSLISDEDLNKLKADAARYNWLCDGNGYFMEEEYLCGHDNDKANADKAIDKEMAREAAERNKS